MPFPRAVSIIERVFPGFSAAYRYNRIMRMPLSSGVNVFSIPVWILLLDIYQRFRMGIRACKSCQSSACFHVPYSAFSFSRTVRFRFQEEDRTDRLKKRKSIKGNFQNLYCVHSLHLSFSPPTASI